MATKQKIDEETTEEVAEQPALLTDAPPAPKSTAWDMLQQDSGYVDPFDAAASPNALADDFEIDIDTTGVESGFQTLPIGTYHGRALGIEKGKPSNSGDPCYVWEFQVTEGDLIGRTAKHWTYTGPRTVWKFAEVKRALGFEDGEAMTPAQIRNRAVTWSMAENTFNNKTRIQVDLVAPPAHHPIGTVIEGEIMPDDVPF